MALVDVVDLLACPHCREPLGVTDRTLRCRQGHSFDLGRQGYVNLLGSGSALRSDTAAMIAARDRFLTAGWYAPFAERLAGTLTGHVPAGTPVLDAGAGTGWYLARVLDRLPESAGLALDLSVPACRRAARAHDRVGAVVADGWGRLPVRDGVCGAVLSVFAPRNPAEFARVLTPGGIAVILSAGPDHLAEVREPLGLLGIEPDKADRLTASMDPWFEPLDQQPVRLTLELDPEALSDLVAMGPNAFHSPAPITTGATVTAAVTITTFRRRSQPS